MTDISNIATTMEEQVNQDSPEWQQIKKNTKFSLKIEGKTSNKVQVIDRGENLKFANNWKVYVHNSDSSDWTLKSYDSDFFVIENISDFMQFFSNFSKFNFRQHNMFIMKQKDDGEFIIPMWEDPMNRNGSTCSIRVDSQSGVELMQQICILMFNNALTSNPSIINGISYSVKTQYAIIKIWLSTIENIEKSLPDTILQKYGNYNMRSKPNEPEY